MIDITFGKARIQDSIRISTLLKTVYIETYAEEGITFEFANFIEKRFSKEYVEKVIGENRNLLLVAYLNNNPIGAAEIIYDGQCPIKKVSVPELSKLYILHRFKGKGVGYRLLLEAEKHIKAKGYNTCNLEVYVENIKAISFYERQGYKKIGKVDFLMEKNTYQNWVMSKSLQ